MAGVVELVLFAVVLGFHTLLAAVMTRYFRITLETTLGWVVYTLLVIPVVLVVTTLVFTGVLSIGPALGGVYVALGVTVGLPFVLGVTIDLLYVPPPEEYELPENRD